jgi:hypothetical protein
VKDECCNEGASATLLEDPEIAVVLGGSLADLQRAGDRLGDEGIDAQIVRGPETDGGGCCSTKLYLVVAREDAQAALAVFDREWRRGLSEEQLAALDAAMASQAGSDTDAMTCPACLTPFDVDATECPDCGLALG